MDRDSASANIDIDDHEICEERRVRLKALESVNGTHLQPEFKHRVYLKLRDAVEEGNVHEFINHEFIKALEKYSAEERVSLSDIMDVQGTSGNSLLHVAVGGEEADIRDKLLSAAKVNYRGDTVLHIPARAGRIRSAELLLSCRSIVDMANETGNTALLEVVKNRPYELTDLRLRQGSRSMNKKNEETKVPAVLGSRDGELEDSRAFDEGGERDNA